MIVETLRTEEQQELNLRKVVASSFPIQETADWERLELFPLPLDLDSLERRAKVINLIDNFKLPQASKDQVDSVEAGIFSSTGNLGREKRPFNRLYDNRPEFTSDSAKLIADFSEMVQELVPNGEITRVVMRGLVTEEALREVLQSSIAPNLEVALYVGEFTSDPSWLIYLAQNTPERSQIRSTDEMINKTETGQKADTDTPTERTGEVLENGYNFVSSFSEDQVDQVHALWKDTFGWSREEVDNLRKRLESSGGDLWFSAVVDDLGNIITAATAEKLDIPGEYGDLSLVENTEWRTKDGYGGKGLMTATLDMLNAQILFELRDNRLSGTPLIYAECNFQSRSDRAGHGAGFRIPTRDVLGKIVPQLIIQNVNIGDGQPNLRDKLRDFTFMYLPEETIAISYNPDQVKNMLSKISSS